MGPKIYLGVKKIEMVMDKPLEDNLVGLEPDNRCPLDEYCQQLVILDSSTGSSAVLRNVEIITRIFHSPIDISISVGGWEGEQL